MPRYRTGFRSLVFTVAEWWATLQAPWHIHIDQCMSLTEFVWCSIGNNATRAHGRCQQAFLDAANQHNLTFLVQVRTDFHDFSLKHRSAMQQNLILRCFKACSIFWAAAELMPRYQCWT